MSMKLILDPDDLKPEFDKHDIPAGSINFYSFREGAQAAIRLVGPCRAYYEEVPNGEKYPIIPPREKAEQADQVTDVERAAAIKEHRRRACAMLLDLAGDDRFSQVFDQSANIFAELWSAKTRDEFLRAKHASEQLK